MPERRRTLALLAGVTLLVGVGIGIVIGSGDGDEDDGAATSTTAVPTAEPPVATAPSATAPPEEGRRIEEQRQAPSVQEAVLRLVDATERGDGVEACRLLGQPAAGTGIEAVQACARAAGVDVGALSGSEGLSLQEIEVDGDRATAQIAGGARIELRRSGDSWRVVAIERRR